MKRQDVRKEAQKLPHLRLGRSSAQTAAGAALHLPAQRPPDRPLPGCWAGSPRCPASAPGTAPHPQTAALPAGRSCRRHCRSMLSPSRSSLLQYQHAPPSFRIRKAYPRKHVSVCLMGTSCLLQPPDHHITDKHSVHACLCSLARIVLSNFQSNQPTSLPRYSIRYVVSPQMPQGSLMNCR